MLTTQQATQIALALLGHPPTHAVGDTPDYVSRFRIDSLTATAGPVLGGLLMDFHLSGDGPGGNLSGPTAYQLYVGYAKTGGRVKLVSVSLSAFIGKTWVRHPVGNMGLLLDGLQEWGWADNLGEGCCCRNGGPSNPTNKLKLIVSLF